MEHRALWNEAFEGVTAPGAGPGRAGGLVEPLADRAGAVEHEEEVHEADAGRGADGVPRGVDEADREELEEAEGVGLAAPQIGKSIRLFIVDCTPWGEDHPELADYRRAFINPEIYEVSEETKLYEEGCLSLPGLHESVRRSLAIRMRYLDENFEPHDEEFTGLPAWVIQHEYDHLEGVVFTDRLSPLRRNLIKSKLMSLTKGRYKCSYKTK